MKKIGIYLMLLILIFNYASLSAVATENTEADDKSSITETEPQRVEDIVGIDAPSAILGPKKMVDNVKAAVVFESNSEAMMYAYNADAPMYPASFVKIMTALIAIENGELSTEVVVTDSAIRSIPYDAVSMKLSANEVITLENLLYGLIVGSANDAAAVIAEHIAGSQQKFVDMMNQRAQSMGCIGTTFTNVHGLHDENQHTTARDAARILNIALKNETFYKVFTTVSVDIPETNKSQMRDLSTGNSLMDKTSRLYFDGRVIGGRTGVTQDGRRCLAAAAKTNGMLLISIVMGAESVYQEDGYSAISVGGYKETSKLLDFCDSKYKAAQILYPGQIIRQLSVADGSSDLVIGPKETLTAVLPKDATVADMSFQYLDKIINAPVHAGDVISRVQVWSGGMCIAQTDLYAMNNVAIRDLQDDARPESRNYLQVTLWIFLIFAVILALGFFVLRYKNRIQHFLMSTRKSKNKNRRRRR